jgi:hypothetical protein
MLVGSTNAWFRSGDGGRNWASPATASSFSTNAIALNSSGSFAVAATSAGIMYSAAAGHQTTVGTSGWLSGGQFDSVELQYAGSGLWTVVGYVLGSAGGFAIN